MKSKLIQKFFYYIQQLAHSCMRFADDIVLIGESREELNEMLETLETCLRSVWLSFD